MRRIFTTLALLVGLLAIGALPVAASDHTSFPDAIPLPDGFFPEGITIDGKTAYVGSLIDGTIVQQDLRTGDTAVFATSPGPGKIAVGMDVDAHGRLWVAGGGPGLDPSVAPAIRVYDTATGGLLLDQPVAAGFVNDVIVTKDAAWFTDSFSPMLIRVPISAGGSIGAPEMVALGGDWEQTAGFNANGIVATPNGKHLIVAQSTAPDVDGAALYRVPADNDAAEVAAHRIALDDTLPGADGLVMVGRTLYSLAGPAGVVEVQLSGQLDSGSIVDILEVPDSVSPTTADVRGPYLYVVDAKFPFFGDPTVPFQTTAILR